MRFEFAALPGGECQQRLAQLFTFEQLFKNGEQQRSAEEHCWHYLYWQEFYDPAFLPAFNICAKTPIAHIAATRATKQYIKPSP